MLGCSSLEGEQFSVYPLLMLSHTAVVTRSTQTYGQCCAWLLFRPTASIQSTAAGCCTQHWLLMPQQQHSLVPQGMHGPCMLLPLLLGFWRQHKTWRSCYCVTLTINFVALTHGGASAPFALYADAIWMLLNLVAVKFGCRPR